MEEDLVEQINNDIKINTIDKDSLDYILATNNFPILDDGLDDNDNLILTDNDQIILEAILKAGPVPITWVRGIVKWYWVNLDREYMQIINENDIYIYIENNYEYVRSCWNDKYPTYRWNW